jgi:hypothetical protein
VVGQQPELPELPEQAEQAEQLEQLELPEGFSYQEALRPSAKEPTPLFLRSGYT